MTVMENIFMHACGQKLAACFFIETITFFLF